jgi:hypothetical protein
MSQQVKKPEGIRAWYGRTTAKARKFLVWATVVGLMGGLAVFAFAPEGFTARVQQFNGAMTIPIFGFIWILGFIYLFLIPQREASFRGQEWIELMVSTFHKLSEEKIAPAVEVWMKIGKQVEAEFPAVLAQTKATMEDLRAAAKKLNEAVDHNGKTIEDIKPAIESLKRIEAKFEAEIKGGLFEKVDTALDSVCSLGGMPGKTEPDETPDLQWAIESIRKNKAKIGGKS